MQALNEETKLGDQIFENLQNDLKTEFGRFWDEHKIEIGEWAKLLAKIEIAKKLGKTNDVTVAYAYAGLACLKARIQYELQDITVQLIIKILGAVLKQALLGF